MPALDLATRLSAAETLARDAGARARAFQSDGVTAVLKADSSLVTEADGAVEAFLRDSLGAAFPDDGFLGEETGGAVEGPTWIIDPIDGTSNFAAGRPFWCVSIGLYVDGAPALGVVFDPLRDELFHGLGLARPMLNGVQLPPIAPRRLGPGVCVGFGVQERGPGRPALALLGGLADAGASVRNLGSGALTLTYVAAGRIDGYFENGVKLWDAAGALALIRGAGLPYVSVFDLANPGAPAPVLAAAPGLFDEIAARRDAQQA